MSSMRPVTNEQATLWNGAAGCAWVEAQELLDGAFRAFEERLVAEASAERRAPVLDVGCGTGTTTLAVARLPEAQAGVVGIDLSEPMLAVARTRAAREGSPASFVCADAPSYAFAPASFGTIISRFGVMFFADPVGAFANLRRAAKDGARLCFVAWRSAAENPFMTTAERAAAPILQNLPARRAGEPGAFAFADERHVARILEESGWADIDVRPMDATCTLPERELLRYVTTVGPVGVRLRGADEETRAQVVERLMPAFAPYVHGPEVRFTAACWIVGARAGGRHA